VNADAPEVIAARINAERARGKLMDTARELQVRLSPATIANNAWSDAKTKGAEVAEQAVDAVRQRPGVAGAVIGALTLFLAREPLIDMASGLKEKVTRKRSTGTTRKKPNKQTESSDE
jgi:hypothetical protein